MARQVFAVRDATSTDAEGLIALWESVGFSAEITNNGDLDTAQASLAAALADPDQRVVVASVDEQVVAGVVLRREQISPLNNKQVIRVSHLAVANDYQRLGYGGILLDVAAAWAEDKDIEHLCAVTAGKQRESNRYLTRLGFATVASFRFVQVATLRKKVAHARCDHSPRKVNRRVQDLITLRRSQRGQ